MTLRFDLNRRDLFKAAGGIVVFFAANPALDAGAQKWPPYPSDFHAYLAVHENGRVSVFTGKIEMGQGVMTSQAQMAAEELGVPLSAIDIVMGDTAQCPWDMGTFGSLTTRMFGPHLRAAAAKARSVLVSLAAERLGSPESALSVKDGVVFVTANPARKIGYGALAKAVQAAASAGAPAPLQVPAHFTVMGTSPHRLDALAKVTGAAKYAADIKRPGMLYARVLRPPQHGATLAHLDLAAARALPGVTVVQDGELIAVLHADPQGAEKAFNAIHAAWNRPNSPLNPDTIFAHMMEAAKEVQTLQSKGDAAGVKPAKALSATYRKGYVAHAPIEPHAALAEVKDGRATIWASTQTPFPTRDRIAKALGLDQRAVRVITPFVGGGFGGKSVGPAFVEAALLSQAVGHPVQVAFTRAEEFYCDTFDPAAVVTIASGLDAKGRIAQWDYAVYAAGGRGATLLYDVPNVRVRSLGGPSFEGDQSKQGLHLFGTGPWRAPGANMNVWAIESQIDALAHAAGADPLAFRLTHLSDPRIVRVLKACAAAFGWKGPHVGLGRGCGIALSSDAGTVAATMAEAEVDTKSGAIKVHRMVCAQDMGVVVNPEGARMQTEGGLTMGLGYTLSEELRFQGGDILDQNFDTYELPRFSWVPKIECVFVRNDALAPQGCGEPPITTVGASVANAVFAASGARLMRLPMTPSRVLAALKA